MLQDLAFDLSLAALLGDNIYNFGELLAHPIVSIKLFIVWLFQYEGASCIYCFSP